MRNVPEDSTLVFGGRLIISLHYPSPNCPTVTDNLAVFAHKLNVNG